MPTWVDYKEAQVERVYPRAPIEKVLGTDEQERATKAWLPSLEMAAALTALRQFSVKFEGKLRRMEERQFKRLKIPEEQWPMKYRDWDGPAMYSGFHRDFCKHSISVDGKSLKVAVRHETLRQDADKKATESSQGDGDGT